MDYFRGCMADVSYNGIRVIEIAKARRNQSEATAVTWNCSPEFETTQSAEISFVEDGAFTIIPRSISRSGSRYAHMYIQQPFTPFQCLKAINTL